MINQCELSADSLKFARKFLCGMISDGIACESHWLSFSCLLQAYWFIFDIVHDIEFTEWMSCMSLHNINYKSYVRGRGFVHVPNVFLVFYFICYDYVISSLWFCVTYLPIFLRHSPACIFRSSTSIKVQDGHGKSTPHFHGRHQHCSIKTDIQWSLYSNSYVDGDTEALWYWRRSQAQYQTGDASSHR